MDERGLVLHPEIAPYDIIIIPIFYNENEKREVLRYIDEIIIKKLEELGLTYFIDLTDKSPGAKYYYWEKRGIPYRIEVGKKEISTNTVTIFSRALRKRVSVSINELGTVISKMRQEYLKYIRDFMSRKVNEYLRKYTIALDIKFEKDVCEKVENEYGLTTIGKVIDVYNLDRSYVGKILFGKKY